MQAELRVNTQEECVTRCGHRPSDVPRRGTVADRDGDHHDPEWVRLDIEQPPVTRNDKADNGERDDPNQCLYCADSNMVDYHVRRLGCLPIGLCPMNIPPWPLQFAALRHACRISIALHTCIVHGVESSAEISKAMRSVLGGLAATWLVSA